MIHAQNAKDGVAIPAKAYTSGVTTTANIDTLGADYCTVRISLGAWKNSNAAGPTITLKESNDTTASNFAVWDTNNTLTATALNATGKEVLYHIDAKSRKRYLQLSVSTGAATNDDIVVSAVYSLTRLGQLPSSTSGMVSTTNDVVVLS